MDPKNWAMDRPSSSRPATEPARPSSTSQGSFSFGVARPGSSGSAQPPHRVHSANARSDGQSLPAAGSQSQSAGGSGAGGSSSRHVHATVSSSALGSAIAAAWRGGLLDGGEDPADPGVSGDADDTTTADPGEEPGMSSATWEASRGSQGDQGDQGPGYGAEEEEEDGYVQEDTGGDNEEVEEAEAGYCEATLGQGLSRGSASGSALGKLDGGPSGAARSSRGSLSPGEHDGEGEHAPASASGSGSGSGRGSGQVSEAEADDADEDWRTRKHKLAAQGMLPAAELAPEEWARIGPPQDATDAAQFVARSYTVEIDMEPQTYVTKRVARPDIWHISKEELARRQATKEAVAFAMQAERRRELEEAELAAQQERVARSTPRGPRYNEFGVFVPERDKSPVRPRYLDWHPDCVGGLTHQQRLAAEAEAERRRRPPGSGNPVGSAVGSRASSAVPQYPQQHQQARGRSMSATAAMTAHLPASRFHGGGYAAAAGQDDFVVEDTSEGPNPLEDVNTAGGSSGLHGWRRGLHSAATGVSLSGRQAATMRPLSPMSRQRRVQSALVGPHSFTPQPKPVDVSEGHFAQILREQRKWLNAPAQPPRPASAAVAAPPPPPSKHYVRPKSAMPAPEGTAPPVPSRVAAAEAATAAAAAAAARPSSALRTVLHPRRDQPSPYAASAGAHAARSRPQSAAGGGAQPWSAASGAPGAPRQLGSSGRTQQAQADRLPWEPKEDATHGPGGRPQSAGAWSYGPGGRRSRPASAGPIARERSVVEGEMLPRGDGTGDGVAQNEKATPRKYAFADESQMYGQMVTGYRKR
ncbi:hypothetical protein HXX76_013775 [Chlamydomonas incerta]|uniref:Uncharacterized protein n=1 Tax=Chlamydomonas incerta TaxID=51695 RepID=A0A835ST14_CHLIN|nr:hypothetical protein HXX76_013775 [Chlamydomonas incerta]|eukprot:KAG2425361.1 hypothetical protein HXX76_013775 [Chlamydomonas incerta]